MNIKKYIIINNNQKSISIALFESIILWKYIIEHVKETTMLEKMSDFLKTD